jgi:hypothetical protein
MKCKSFSMVLAMVGALAASPVFAPSLTGSWPELTTAIAQDGPSPKVSRPRSRNWHAFENRQPPVDPTAVRFYVKGEVETNVGIKPVLKRAVQQGINPAILILEFTLEDEGGGDPTDIYFKDVRFDEKVMKGRYREVEIRYETTTVALIAVVDVY